MQEVYLQAYACQIFRDDAAAQAVEGGAHLRPMTPPQVRVRVTGFDCCSVRLGVRKCLAQSCRYILILMLDNAMFGQDKVFRCRFNADRHFLFLGLCSETSSSIVLCCCAPKHHHCFFVKR